MPLPRLGQTVFFGDRELAITFAALKSFSETRQTTNPDVAMWIVIGIVLLIVAMGVVILVLFQRKHELYVEQVLENEKQKRRLADTARAAHERTIAYACHQLRYGLLVHVLNAVVPTAVLNVSCCLAFLFG